MGLHTRVNIGECADSARNGAGGNFILGRHKAGAAAGKFGISLRQFQAESHRFGVNAVAAADGGGHFMLDRAALERGQQRIHIGNQQVCGARQLHIEASVQHIR